MLIPPQNYALSHFLHLEIPMDYETFGEHQWAETGIFDFMRYLPGAVLSSTNFEFLTPSEVADKHQPVAVMHGAGCRYLA